MSDKTPSSGKNPGKRDHKPALSSASADDKTTRPTESKVASAVAKETKTTVRHREEKKSGGWIAPVALLFGLVGTGFSAYLYSQLKSLGNSTSTMLSSQAELIESKASEQSSSLTETTETLSSAIDTKASEINEAVEAKAAELDGKTQALQEELGATATTIREEVEGSKTEIATTTAAAVQELTSKTELEINNISTSFNTGLALLREKTAERLDSLDVKMGDLDESVKTTNEIATRGQRDWVLAEVSYLLRTGVHRVKLAGDVKAGVIALESASERLHTLGDIDYLPVREQIAEEVSALRQVGPPDIEGLIFKLQTMSKRADSLPLPGTLQAEAEAEATSDVDPASAGVALGKSLLERFKGTVKIVPADGDSSGNTTSNKRQVQPTKEQLSTSESLRLHLEAARLSALRHDADTFTNHMDNAIGYSSEMFDQDSDQVKTFVSDLTELRNTSIVPQIASLGSSLSLFNKIDSKRGTN